MTKLFSLTLGRRWGLLLLLGFSAGAPAAPGAVAEPVPEIPANALTAVEGTRVHATEEEPRVLHIVPWQAPTLARRERQELSLPGADTLLQPLDIEVMRTHRQFRQTLDVLQRP